MGELQKELQISRGLLKKTCILIFDTTFEKSPLALSVVSELDLPGKND